MENVKTIGILGKGLMGTVYLILSNGHYYAVKKISKILTKRKEIKESYDKELKMLSELKHKNIINLIKIHQDVNYHYLTLEYCNGNSLLYCLQKYIKKYKTPFSEEIVQYLMKQIVDGLQCIHQHGIIHRNMKLANILVKFPTKEDIEKKNMLKAELKICDFGISIKAEEAFTAIGTLK